MNDDGDVIIVRTMQHCGRSRVADVFLGVGYGSRPIVVVKAYKFRSRFVLMYFIHHVIQGLFVLDPTALVVAR